MGGQWLSYLSLPCLVRFRPFVVVRISDDLVPGTGGFVREKVVKTR